MAGDPMDSIDLHQSAGLCAQPEAAQDNPQNLSTARTNSEQQYVYQTLFFPTHAQKSGYVTLTYFWKSFQSSNHSIEIYYTGTTWLQENFWELDLWDWMWEQFQQFIPV